MPPTSACRRSYKSTISTVSREKSSSLDITVLRDVRLQDVLTQQRLAVRQTVLLRPEHYLAQHLRPWIAGVYVAPTSAPVAIAHRKVGARTQSRVELVPGWCLLRAASARAGWTLAIPPLLAGLRRAAQTRELVVLVENSTRDEANEEGADQDVLVFDEHQPRAPR